MIQLLENAKCSLRNINAIYENYRLFMRTQKVNSKNISIYSIHLYLIVLKYTDANEYIDWVKRSQSKAGLKLNGTGIVCINKAMKDIRTYDEISKGVGMDDAHKYNDSIFNYVTLIKSDKDKSLRIIEFIAKELELFMEHSII